ncbi:MAG: hypothetical protein DI623_09345 [Sphingomonas sanxanigenens]|uniref:Uncharacterized protein n=1 Tax=Sphingomonas sanxanigenens TaxID=397260 RepID=A0A2W5A903_9SPHN|nr:MAG: hypothetical protein DI623_09345 [Sphingomonas sanxanigenens]
MTRRALHLHVAEPYYFEATNGASDLIGWTETPEYESEWIVHFNKYWRLGDESFNRVLVSPRYDGEVLDSLDRRILGLAVNIRRWREDGWHFDMIGTLSPHREQA